MTLNELIQPQEAVFSPETAVIQVINIQYHSGACSGGSLFFALSGSQADGNRFIAEAVENGAVAVVTEKNDLEAQVPVIHVSDARKILARTADRFYGNPQNNLHLIGVTGTNGKTTVCHLVRAIYQKAGIPCGLLGTIHHYIDDSFMQNNGITTPESLDIHRYFSEMIAAGKRACVMEVSSHSITLDRVYGIGFNTAVFTNMSRDHLDFHCNFESYMAAKRRLFENLDPNRDARAILNADDPVFINMKEACPVGSLTYGMIGQPDIYPLHTEMNVEGSKVLLSTPSGEVKVTVHLPGNFNILNTMAAVGVGLTEGIDLGVIAEGIGMVKGISGRFESVQCGQDFDVFIDYAHTPDALGHILKSSKALTRSRLISVFGCGGDRDRGKRPEMGKISTEIADVSVITSDNPRSEVPEAIIEDILTGISGNTNFIVIPDRRKAIQHALDIAEPGDTVVISGKGHEDYQVIGTEKIHFDDREEVCKILDSGKPHSSGY